MLAQGAENFKKEFEQLRRAFRFDEFKNLSNASPASDKWQEVLPGIILHRVPPLNRWYECGAEEMMMGGVYLYVHAGPSFFVAHHLLMMLSLLFQFMSAVCILCFRW